MFVLKQFLKVLILPPLPWMLMLLAVLIFWRRRWARKLLFVTLCLIVVLHSGIFVYSASLSAGIALSTAHRPHQGRSLMMPLLC